MSLELDVSEDLMVLRFRTHIETDIPMSFFPAELFRRYIESELTRKISTQINWRYFEDADFTSSYLDEYFSIKEVKQFLYLFNVFVESGSLFQLSFTVKSGSIKLENGQLTIKVKPLAILIALLGSVYGFTTQYEDFREGVRLLLGDIEGLFELSQEEFISALPTRIATSTETQVPSAERFVENYSYCVQNFGVDNLEEAMHSLVDEMNDEFNLKK